MQSFDVGPILLTLVALLGATHSVGYIFARLRQPRLIGEILAGVLFGPFVLGRLAPEVSARLFGEPGGPTEVVLAFLYWLGLMMLMFVSGSHARDLVAREYRRQVGWLLVTGTLLPLFGVLAAGAAGWLPLAPLSGRIQVPAATLLVLAIAAAVTSIPVISRIFQDLGILGTRFASLILGVAVLEDIVLWALLAVATGLAENARTGGPPAWSGILLHCAGTLAFTLVGLTVAPRLMRRVRRTRFNLVARTSPVAYVLVVMLGYGALAAALDVNLIFAAFLAGYGVVGGAAGKERKAVAAPLDAIAKVATAFFVPVYFAMVGYKLELGREFSGEMLAWFLLGSTALALVARGAGAAIAGFGWLDRLNIAITSNARGGPGIVLASVAYEAGIISAAFYTTLVLTAILTSQLAGAWLGHVLRAGWPLLSGDTDHGHDTSPRPVPARGSEAAGRPRDMLGYPPQA